MCIRDSLLPHPFGHPAETGEADPSPEAGAAQDAHGTAVSVALAVGHRPGGAGGVDKGVGGEASAVAAEHRLQAVPLPLDPAHPGLKDHLHPQGAQVPEHLSRNQPHIIEGGVGVAGKGDVPVPGAAVGEGEELPRPPGLHLQRCGEAAVVLHDPPHPPGPQQLSLIHI